MAIRHAHGNTAIFNFAALRRTALDGSAQRTGGKGGGKHGGSSTSSAVAVMPPLELERKERAKWSGRKRTRAKKLAGKSILSTNFLPRLFSRWVIE